MSDTSAKPPAGSQPLAGPVGSEGDDHALTGSGAPGDGTGLPAEDGDTASAHDQGADPEDAGLSPDDDPKRTNPTPQPGQGAEGVNTQGTTEDVAEGDHVPGDGAGAATLHGKAGAGAASEGGIAGDGGNAAAEATEDQLLAPDRKHGEGEGHPEPISAGFVQQDNVTEPGVQTTTDRLSGTESRHGDPDEAVALDEEPVVVED